MRTKVFAYNGFIGIQSIHTAEGLLNDPTQIGQLGFVVDAKFVDISPDALELLKKVSKSHDDIGDVDVFGASDDMVIFAWLGSNLRIIDPENCEGSRDYDASLLTACTEPIEVPEDFKKVVDAHIATAN